MTKEEEAIERLEEYLKNSAYKRVDSDFFKNGGWEIVDLEVPQSIEKVLNILKQNSAEIAEKSAEIEKYKSLYNKALKDLVQADRENIENKKVIDLMAETIRKLAISLASYEGSYNKETINFTGNIKDIKQYYERKSEK